MGKAEIEECLKKVRPKKLTRTEIAELLDERPEKITNLLTKLLKETFGCVKFKTLDRKKAMKIYNCKHKIRLYYYEG